MNFEPSSSSQHSQPQQSLPVTILDSVSIDELRFHVQVKRFPTIFRGCDIGPCVSKWTTSYLKTVNPEKKIKVHKSRISKLDFRNKNFAYETITFQQLIENCEDLNKQELNPTAELDNSTDVTESSEEKPTREKYFWYLRSLGEDPRGKDVSDLATHFPELYSDLQIPPVFEPAFFFSSVFRITSAKLQLWTHYDTCDNILIQVRGRKRIIFFPPSEALNLYLEGDKSEVIDVDNPDPTRFPKFISAQRYEAVLEEGDIVFIPALWFHNVTALNFSVSVNVFWKNLGPEFYDKKDTYGNKDLVPAQLSFITLNKAVANLSKLPEEYKDFYIRRMIISLQKKLEY